MSAPRRVRAIDCSPHWTPRWQSCGPPSPRSNDPTHRMFDSLHRLPRAPMIVRTIAMLRAAGRSDLVVAGFAIAALMVAQLTLSKAFYGTNFGGGDGKMAQAVILAAQRFGGFLQFNNI